MHFDPDYDKKENSNLNVQKKKKVKIVESQLFKVVLASLLLSLTASGLTINAENKKEKYISTVTRDYYGEDYRIANDYVFMDYAYHAGKEQIYFKMLVADIESSKEAMRYFLEHLDRYPGIEPFIISEGMKRLKFNVNNFSDLLLLNQMVDLGKKNLAFIINSGNVDLNYINDGQDVKNINEFGKLDYLMLSNDDFQVKNPYANYVLHLFENFSNLGFISLLGMDYQNLNQEDIFKLSRVYIETKMAGNDNNLQSIEFEKSLKKHNINLTENEKEAVLLAIQKMNDLKRIDDLRISEKNVQEHYAYLEDLQEKLKRVIGSF